MKKNLFKGAVIAMGMAVAVTSCSDDSSSIGAGMGRISPQVEVDSEVIMAKTPAGSRANEEDALPGVSDLKLKLTSEDGSYSKEWNSVDEFDPQQDFKTGNYTLEAYYGSADDAEGKAKPYFYGKQSIEVKFDRTTTVALHAKMENSRVKIAYTDAFRDYMTSYTAQLHTPKGNYIDVAATETAPVYVSTGTVNVNLTFTKPNGTTATIEAARFTAKAKTEHVVTFDVNNGDAGGDAILKVTFDDTVDTENVEIDLSDDLINAPAPELTAEGFTDGQNFDIVEGGKAPAKVKMNFVARGKVGAVMLSTDSRSLKEAGWPAELDLISVDEAMQARLKNLGLDTRGIWKNPDMLGVIDFSGVFSHLKVSTGYEESVNKFTLQVKDKYSKLSEVLSFTVTVDKGEVSITKATSKIGSNTVNTTVEFNGDDFENEVKFQIRDDLGLGTWNDLTTVSATRANVSSRAVPCTTYNITLRTDAPMQQEMTIRAVYRDLKPEATVTLTMPEFKVAATDVDIYATHAYFTVSCDEADAATVAKFIDQVTLEGNALGKTVDGTTIHVTGLNPGVANNLTFAGNGSSATATVTTEAATQLPNSDMETWTSNAHKEARVEYFVGGDVWGTLNPLTVKDAKSTGNYAYTASSGTLPDDAGAHGKAALIRTIAWGSGTTAAGSTSTIKQVDRGELFLGSWGSTIGDNVLPDYGISFASRPSSLSFNYKFESYNNRYGYAEVKVLDASGNEIASGNVVIADKADFTEMTIPLTYAAKSPKAAKLIVIFRSTNVGKSLGDGSALGKDDVNLVFDANFIKSNSVHVGSKLYIDDITLNY